jgi:hypothetical protein
VLDKILKQNYCFSPLVRPLITSGRAPLDNFLRLKKALINQFFEVSLRTLTCSPLFRFIRKHHQKLVTLALIVAQIQKSPISCSSTSKESTLIPSRIPPNFPFASDQDQTKLCPRQLSQIMIRKIPLHG